MRLDAMNLLSNVKPVIIDIRFGNVGEIIVVCEIFITSRRIEPLFRIK